MHSCQNVMIITESADISVVKERNGEDFMNPYWIELEYSTNRCYYALSDASMATTKSLCDV